MSLFFLIRSAHIICICVKYVVNKNSESHIRRLYSRARTLMFHNERYYGIMFSILCQLSCLEVVSIIRESEFLH